MNDWTVIANFMGEATEECGGGLEVEENLNYRAPVLHSQWPSHFTMDQALAMQHQPALIANQAYNGRMGNRIGTNDGWNYRGRGPAQSTGAEAYALLTKLLGVDFVNHPELINTTERFFEVGLVDFTKICGCLPYAERDDEINETRHLNGGLFGLLSERPQSGSGNRPSASHEPRPGAESHRHGLRGRHGCGIPQYPDHGAGSRATQDRGD